MVAHNAINLTGHIYNRLTVIKLHKQDEKHKYWECRCQCGNIKIIEGSKLRSGHTKSCGCYKVEQSGKQSITHGKSYSSEYGTWNSMKQRCLNVNDPAYKDYGGRGVTIYQEWIDSFKSFYAYVGNKPSQKHSIDRIDNNGNYEPGNVRWALPIIQANNRRKNHYIEFNGQTKTISEWAKIVKLPYYVVIQRIAKYGWTINDALTTPNNDYQIDISYNGKTMKSSEWAKEVNISSDNIVRRIIDRGWSAEDALTKPLIKDFLIDYTGKIFGRLTVIERDLTRHGTYWICKCECGNIKSIHRNNLGKGYTQSCGCLHKERTSEAKLKDLTGEVFERLTVISRDYSKKNGSTYWLCQCSCGNTKIINGASLKQGHTRSCGCLNKECLSKRDHSLRKIKTKKP
jgi:hypothetical protein